MEKEKRVVKGYKIKKSVYDKAMKRAAKQKVKLANVIESAVLFYAFNWDLKAKSFKDSNLVDIPSLTEKLSHPPKTIKP